VAIFLFVWQDEPNQNIIIFKKLSSWKKQLKILIQIIQQPSFPVWGFAIKEKTESLKG